jgi:hypothetical protein
MYMRAFIECTPDGARTRGLGGKRQCSRPQVADIVIRPSPGSRLVVITTKDGVRFWLGAPVDGGVMPDPEFSVKFDQIVDYCLAAVGDDDGCPFFGVVVQDVARAEHPAGLPLVGLAGAGRNRPDADGRLPAGA